MLRFYPLLLLTLCFSLTFAQTTSTVTGDLTEVRILGASDTNENIVRVRITARPGTPVERIDLEAERNRILSIGTFSEVSLSIEDRGNGPVLFVRVTENPTIAEVNVEGSSFPEARLVEFLNQANLLEPGVTFNTLRAEEARDTLQQIYRENGYPFEVPVTLDITPIDPEALTPEALPEELPANEPLPVILTYTVTENVPLDEVVFEGATVLEEETLERIFRPLERATNFDNALYGAAVAEVSEAYEEAGFRGSGVDPLTSELVDGVLSVRLRELEIASIDTTALGVDPSELSLGEGDLFNYNTLLEDVRELAEGRSSDVRLDWFATSSGDVRVTFESGPPDSAGPVEEVVIEGNTVFDTDTLKELLTLNAGDTFTSELADEDFRNLQALYRESGYLLVPEPDYNYLDGVYVQRLNEIRVAGYDIAFEGDDARTDPTVITRYLQDQGEVFNENRLRNGLVNVARLGAVQPLQALPTFPDPNEPDQAVITIDVREAETRTFSPEARYATDTGFQAGLSYGDSNFLGQAHNFNAEVTAQTSDAGFQLGGSINYNIPWLYVDFLDFQEVPTAVSASLFSVVTTNQPLTADGSTRIPFPGLPEIDANRVLVGDYAERSTGLRFSVGRPLFENTSLRFSASGSYSAYLLESEEACRVGANGNIVDRDCSLSEEAAREFLPQSGLSSFISTSLVYDTRDNLVFPRSGWVVSGRGGLGFGSDFRNEETGEQQSYIYEQLEFGAKTYFRLEELAPELDDPNHVLAFRLNAGHQFGGAYPTSKLFVVGDTPNEGTQIRGYTRDDFDPSKTYLTGSAEYRYDFGVNTFATQTIIGVVFADFGYASSVPGFDDYNTALFLSAGLGVQLNLGFSGIGLPPVRLEYGFSERHASGVFRFRVGPVF